MDLPQRFKTFVESQGLVRQGDRVLLAVSGGVDSVVLLNLFLGIQRPLQLTLSVAHLNHGLRGWCSDRDEIFVRNLARSRGLCFHASRADVGHYARMKKRSLEEGAREVRFDFLETLLNRLRYDKLALGHHANDRAETVLMNLMRGAGLRGVGSIRPMRGRVIHPLLFARRCEIEAYAAGRRLDFVVDASNRDGRFLRNRLRWGLVWELERSSGSRPVVPAICRAADAAAEAEDFIDEVARGVRRRVVVIESDGEIILDIDRFLRYFRVVQKAVILQVLDVLSVPRQRVRSFDVDGVLKLAEEGRSGGVVDFGEGIRVVRSRKKLVFVRASSPLVETPLEVGRSVGFWDGRLQLRSELVTRGEIDPVLSHRPEVVYVDYDVLSFPLSLRFWRPGDWFIPLGMRGRKKLQDFFVDEKIPNYRRHAIPLLVGGGAVVWVVGYRIDDRFKVTEKTERVLKLEVVRGG